MSTDLHTILTAVQDKHPEWFAEDLPPNLSLLTGTISNEAVAALLSSCGVHLCPSAREGFGHYINEARAAGE